MTITEIPAVSVPTIPLVLPAGGGSTLEARVATGARWLDHILPGWWRDVNLGMLSVSSSSCCPLGQLFDRGRIGGYGYALATYGGGDPVQWSVDLGFERDEGEDAFEQYDELDRLWSEVIAFRRLGAL